MGEKLKVRKREIDKERENGGERLSLLDSERIVSDIVSNCERKEFIFDPNVTHGLFEPFTISQSGLDLLSRL